MIFHNFPAEGSLKTNDFEHCPKMALTHPSIPPPLHRQQQQLYDQKHAITGEDYLLTFGFQLTPHPIFGQY